MREQNGGKSGQPDSMFVRWSGHDSTDLGREERTKRGPRSIGLDTSRASKINADNHHFQVNTLGLIPPAILHPAEAFREARLSGADVRLERGPRSALAAGLDRETIRHRQGFRGSNETTGR